MKEATRQAGQVVDPRQRNSGSSEPGEWLTTGEMARRSGTTLRTVRFYESEGLIASMARADGAHRRFQVKEFRKLQIISSMRDSGLSLQRIKELIAIKAGCGTPRAAAYEVTTALCAQLEDLERRIETLERVRADLTSTVATLKPCHDCKEPDFPVRCHDCVVVNQPECSRSTQLLWKN